MITGFLLQNLPDSGQRLEALFQAFDDLMFVLDNNGTILDYKAGNGALLNVFPENFMHLKLHDIFPPAVGRKFDSALRDLRAEGGYALFEYMLPGATGESWYEARLVPFASQQTIVFVRNITKHKKSEIKIKRQLDQLAALRTIDLAINSGLDLNLTLSMILEHVRQQLNIDAASILLLSPRTQMLEYAAGSGFSTPALQHTRLKVGEGYAGRAVLERRVLHVANLQSRGTDFLRAPYFSQENFVAYYAVPLVSKGRPLGVLEIFHRATLAADQDWLNFMDTLAGQAAIAIDSAIMFKDLQWSNAELRMAYEKTIEGWSRALDLRDKETEDHTRRVTEMTIQLAQKLGIPDAELIHIRRGAILHDIGKVSISDSILLKAGKLTEAEWTIMRRHPLIAVELLSPIAYLAPALHIPRSHHEKWDGTGYPDGLAGEQIPLAARIFTLADVYDALMSDRPYRRAWSKADTLEYIRTQAGKHFDPQIIPAFLEMLNGR
jgi:putative nucleotidyltransferase with HDIG domain